MEKCKWCNDTGWMQYDHNHSQICPHCCKHRTGLWVLSEWHGKDKGGKFCCLTGCGKIWDTIADYEKETGFKIDYMTIEHGTKIFKVLTNRKG